MPHTTQTKNPQQRPGVCRARTPRGPCWRDNVRAGGVQVNACPDPSAAMVARAASLPPGRHKKTRERNVRTNQQSTLRHHLFVGASFGHTDDQSARFLEEGIWEISSPSQKEQALVRSMRPGERIAIKAAYVRKHGCPFDNRQQPVSVMGIKATGVITETHRTVSMSKCSGSPPMACASGTSTPIAPPSGALCPANGMRMR